jgi:hypothetical protein
VIFVNIVEIPKAVTTILSEEIAYTSLLLISYPEKPFPIQIHIIAMVRKNSSIVSGFPSANRRDGKEARSFAYAKIRGSQPTQWARRGGLVSFAYRGGDHPCGWQA